MRAREHGGPPARPGPGPAARALALLALLAATQGRSSPRLTTARGAAAPSPTAPSPRFPKGTGPTELGPPPPGLRDWSAARCQRCHRAEAEAHLRSGHAQARASYVFLAALRREEPTFCLRCHAPQASRPLTAPAADAPMEERGVACGACHAPAGVALTDSRLCAGCHQFGFSLRDGRGALVGLSPRPQQDTFAEWRRYQAATGDDRGCAACHMRGGDHSMGGVRRLEALRGAVELTARPGEIALALRGVGHRLPTGDIMRWLSLEVAADPLFEAPLRLRAFGRTLERERGAERSVRVAEDSTLDPLAGPLRIAVPEADAAGRPLAYYRLLYHLISPQQEADGMLPEGLARLVIAAGPLPRRPDSFVRQGATP